MQSLNYEEFPNEIIITINTKKVITLFDKNIESLQNLMDDIYACENAMDEIINQQNQKIQHGLEAIKKHHNENPDMLLSDNNPINTHLQNEISLKNKSTNDYEQMLDNKIMQFNHQLFNCEFILFLLFESNKPNEQKIIQHYLKYINNFKQQIKNLGY